MYISSYELYFNKLNNPSLLDLLIYKLYKWKNFNKLIYFIDKFKFRKIKHKEKIIEDINVNDININSPNGYKQISHIYRTQPFIIYKLILENNIELTCADNHLVYSSINYTESYKFVKDLTLDDYILTKDGWVKVKHIEQTKENQYMFDVELDSEEHNYYSNDIVSHNTTTVNKTAA